MRPHNRFQLIATDADLRAGVAALRRKCPVMRRIHDATGNPPLRRYAADFEGLARIVVGQQLSVASAAAIWRRTRAQIEPFQAASLLALDQTALRSAGLSQPKIRTLTACALAVTSGQLDFDTLPNAPELLIRERLIAISGVGPWTADIFLMFCLGRADAWAPGDLALRLATQIALNLAETPPVSELERIADRWRPWRGVAARLLWAHYGLPKIDPGKHASRPSKPATGLRSGRSSTTKKRPDGGASQT